MLLTFTAIMVNVCAAIGVTVWLSQDLLRRKIEALHVSVDLLSDQVRRLDGKIESVRIALVAAGVKRDDF